MMQNLFSLKICRSIYWSHVLQIPLLRQRFRRNLAMFYIDRAKRQHFCRLRDHIRRSKLKRKIHQRKARTKKKLKFDSSRVLYTIGTYSQHR